jgi:AcrR family transcriptional regulator
MKPTDASVCFSKIGSNVAREQSRSEVRRERILESALNVFARRGYRDAAMDEIASESETSKGGLYFHFPNKQTIFVALLDRMAALLMTRTEAAIAEESDPVRRIDVALDVVVSTFASHRRLSRLFLIDAVGAGRELNDKMLDVHRAFATMIARHIDEAVRQGAIPPLDVHVAAKAWFGAINEVVLTWVLDDDGPPLEDALPTLRALLRRSVGAPAETGVEQ